METLRDFLWKYCQNFEQTLEYYEIDNTEGGITLRGGVGKFLKSYTGTGRVDDGTRVPDISVDLNKGWLYICEEWISNLLETIEHITNRPYIFTRTLTKVAGKIIST